MAVTCQTADCNHGDTENSNPWGCVTPWHWLFISQHQKVHTFL